MTVKLLISGGPRPDLEIAMPQIRVSKIPWPPSDTNIWVALS